MEEAANGSLFRRLTARIVDAAAIGPGEGLRVGRVAGRGLMVGLSAIDGYQAAGGQDSEEGANDASLSSTPLRCPSCGIAPAVLSNAKSCQPKSGSSDCSRAEPLCE